MLYIVLGFVTAFAVVYFATPALIRVSYIKQLVDVPNEARKKHKRSVPTIGGINIFAASLFAYAICFPWSSMNFFGGPQNFVEAVQTFKFLVSASILIFFIGIKDDIVGVAPLKKLAGHAVVGIILVVLADIRISSLHGLFGFYEINYFLSIPLSIFVYIVIVNSFNLIDGSDGLAAGTGVVTSTYFGGWFFLTYQNDMSLLAFVLAGALVGFLVFNFSPARIFMGDSGSLFIGAVTFALAVKCIETNGAQMPGLAMQVSSPVFAMSVLAYPLIDTLRVFILRIARGQSPFTADRSHIHHSLIDRGFNHAQTAIILYMVSIMVPAVCLLFVGVESTTTFLAMAVLSVLIVHSTFLLRVRKRQAVA